MQYSLQDLKLCLPTDIRTYSFANTNVFWWKFNRNILQESGTFKWQIKSSLCFLHQAGHEPVHWEWPSMCAFKKQWRVNMHRKLNSGWSFLKVGQLPESSQVHIFVRNAIGDLYFQTCALVTKILLYWLFSWVFCLLVLFFIFLVIMTVVMEKILNIKLPQLNGDFILMGILSTSLVHAFGITAMLKYWRQFKSRWSWILNCSKYIFKYITLSSWENLPNIVHLTKYCSVILK